MENTLSTILRDKFSWAQYGLEVRTEPDQIDTGLSASTISGNGLQNSPNPQSWALS